MSTALVFFILICAQHPLGTSTYNAVDTLPYYATAAVVVIIVVDGTVSSLMAADN